MKKIEKEKKFRSHFKDRKEFKNLENKMLIEDIVENTKKNNRKEAVESKKTNVKSLEKEKGNEKLADKDIEKTGEIRSITVNKNDPRGNIYFLNIVGQIEGHIESSKGIKTTKYEHVIPKLVGVAQDKNIDGMLILLNTVGGDVEAGLAIAELIANIGKPTVSLVIGGGHSIGIPLAVSADYSFIAQSATMIIHPVRLSGTVIGAQQTYDYFNKIQDRIVKFIITHSKIEEKKINQLMFETSKLLSDMGSLLVGEEAVLAKIIDKSGGLFDATEKLYELIAKNKSNLD